MRLFKKIFLILFLCLILVYVTNITSIPSNIILFQNEKINLQTVYGVTISENTNENSDIIVTSSAVQNNNNTSYTVNLFGIDVKKINVETIEKTTVVPLGNTIGLKLYTSGVLIVGLTEINGEKPYKNSGLEEGDLITCVNQTQVTTTEELTECVNRSQGKEIEITYVKNGKEHKTEIEPIKTGEDEYKIGLWVKDGAAGVGTITYYEPSTEKFAALGHGIVDSDTEELVTIASGKIVTTNITEIVKGKNGEPGEIKGTIINGTEIGNIYKNSNFGIYGNLENLTTLSINTNEAIEVATREEIQEGKAEITTTLEKGKRKNYEIEIKKIYKKNNTDNKSMLIKITDQELINLTGGIIQGMSGAPITQNGKFIGAITNVLISDPTTGYAVFGDIMIKQMRQTN